MEVRREGLLPRRHRFSTPVGYLGVLTYRTFGGADWLGVDGIEWRNVNTSRLIEIAVQLCTLLAGELGIVFIDNFEHCDAEMQQLLIQGLVAAGFQLFAAIVSDDPELTIETYDLAA